MVATGRNTARLAIGAGLGVLLLASVAMREVALEYWHIWRLDSGAAGRRLEAARFLGRTRTERALTALLTRMDESVRARADLAALQDELEDQQSELHVYAAGVLAHGEAAVPHLQARLRSGSRLERVLAARQLAELGRRSRAAVPDLIRSARADGPLVEPYAIDALGKIGPDAEAALPYLRERLGHSLGAALGEALGEALGAAQSSQDGATLPSRRRLIIVIREAIERIESDYD